MQGVTQELTDARGPTHTTKQKRKGTGERFRGEKKEKKKRKVVGEVRKGVAVEGGI